MHDDQGAKDLLNTGRHHLTHPIDGPSLESYYADYYCLSWFPAHHKLADFLCPRFNVQNWRAWFRAPNKPFAANQRPVDKRSCDHARHPFGGRHGVHQDPT